MKEKMIGDPSAPVFFVQMVDEHDASLLEKEAAALREACPQASWCLLAVPVEDWNRDLAPWPAPPVFGRQSFGDGAAETLKKLEKRLDAWEESYPLPGRKCVLGGYSLAGLFALWAGSRTDRFDGIAAVSPSVWYPGWTDYAAAHPMRARAVYLSLGDREERTKNPVMREVGTAIRRQEELLKKAGVSCRLEWNPGNHFADSELRTAKGLSWFLE